MDISVVIVSYNVSSFLDQVLTTLKDSTRELDYEVFDVRVQTMDDYNENNGYSDWSNILKVNVTKS